MLQAIRKLYDWELNKYRDHLLALDAESRHLRFSYLVKDEAIENFITTIEKDISNHRIFVIENDDLEVVGVGHISLAGGNTELAFSVLKEYQGNGYGDALMKRCLGWCQNRGISSGFMVCLQRNQVIKHLAAKNGLTIHSDCGESTANIELPNMTIESLSSEMFSSTLAAFDHFGKTTRKLTNISIQALTFN